MNGVRIVVRGGGDLGSGVALRLWRAGFSVVVLETDRPVAVRRTVAFSEAVYDGSARVEEARGCLVTADVAMLSLQGDYDIPVVIDPAGKSIEWFQPFAVVDAILAKRNCGTRKTWAPLVVGLGPGFTAPLDVHAVVETNRGPHLGRVIWRGSAEPNTGVPGSVQGIGAARVLRAPAAGPLRTILHIGAMVDKGQAIAAVGERTVRAPFDSLVRGLARDGLQVQEGMKIGDLDPRLDPELCRLVSDKSLAIAGGVLEAVMMSLRGATNDRHV